VIAHVVFSVWGYALLDKVSLPKEISTMLGGGVYPGMITATIGTGLLLAVVATSIVIVRRKLSYEWWYAVHLMAYAGIALGWFHQIPTGNELVLATVAADYWRGLYAATIAVLVVFRVLLPAAAALRHRLRVAEVVEEGPGVVSLRIACTRSQHGSGAAHLLVAGLRLGTAARPAPGARRPVLHLALPHVGPLVERPPVLAVAGA